MKKTILITLMLLVAFTLCSYAQRVNVYVEFPMIRVYEQPVYYVPAPQHVIYYVPQPVYYQTHRHYRVYHNGTYFHGGYPRTRSRYQQEPRYW